MLGIKAIRSRRPHALGRALLIGTASGFALAVAPAVAHAHFILVTPDAWM